LSTVKFSLSFRIRPTPTKASRTSTTRSNTDSHRLTQTDRQLH